MLAEKRILLIIGGGIAAYKVLDLVRRLRERGARVRPVMTAAAKEFVTPLSVGALCADHVFTDLFDRHAEQDVGHIRLARETDLIVVAPATADLMAKLAQGLANDLASAVLLATTAPVLMAPAMNPRMWAHPATRRNHAQLQADGVTFVGPNTGEMAEAGEAGTGRMAEPMDIVEAIAARLAGGPLAGRHVLVTSGPTHEPIDPVRYIANRSSGAQGTALAAALRDLGARVTFVTGPAEVPAPAGVAVQRVETAVEMLAAVEAALPADAAVFAAAVADWRVANAAARKMKKDGSGRAPALEFAENPDILARVAQMRKGRPALVVGFAAETDDVIAHASAKLARKGCDWIVANDVSPATGIMGGAENAVTILSPDGAEAWPRLPKDEVARRLAAKIAAVLGAGK
ncbi:MAG: bifunctional phosphopantothenoylcysteine decarboxylase/phosphopantothenate--cysteine ligase CoaBC [Defluviimonas sp.]|uniref:bifunctional phosphopantothenoylcysteine decarboxylase/phosphopantothenate--cysteine ligase CoaBC n=1 Tax=Albidovulum sp. TaxID=1872424 RepID=UPI001D9AECC5|nr:bifunctional phosphopantothenoylcysteine decarboxylase/phosphopantothenate--cysteine ligase CoaBC [Paracoccaceae bacterium]MCC0065288.1 bifunctional phosphopantothenoylcysteine decarboxylase/phosphopantothenate--cysteine ligase CoaBC [Defluviimonas sp.]